MGKFVELDDGMAVNLDHVRGFGEVDYAPSPVIVYSNGDVVEITTKDAVRIEKALISAGSLFNEVRYELEKDQVHDYS